MLARLGAACARPVAQRALWARTNYTYTLAQHQWRAERQQGRVANKFAFTRGKPRVDKKFAECERAWILVDGYGESMGRLASKVVQLLLGKHKPIFEGKRDVGDYVVVVNAAYVLVPQNALDTKKYYSHSGWPGGLKTKPLWRLFEDNPTEPLRRAIFGMMPNNKLRYQRMTRLRLYPTATHTHEAQFRAMGNKAFKAVLPPGLGRGVQLERIRPALEAGSIE